MLGFITNHSYLDNPTFRGMRWALMNSFDEVYILDLHGNSLKKEKAPDGSKDENVFDIQQGVAIALFVKKKDKNAEERSTIFRPEPQMDLEFKKKEEKPEVQKKECLVHHAELWGARADKYEWLNANNIKTTEWTMIKPKSEFYFFVQRDEELLASYEKFLKITDAFPVNSVGIVTARDSLTIQWTSRDVWTTVLNFSKLDVETARQAYGLGQDARDWKVELAQNDLKDSGLEKQKIVPILYRPFDMRYTYYTGKSRGFHCMPRPEVMRHMMQANLGLIIPKQFKEESGAFVAKTIIGHKTVSAYDINYLFPLYLYPEEKKPKKKIPSTIMMIFDQDGDYSTRKPNLSAALIEGLAESYKKTPLPEQVFFYIYAVLYSNTYRTKYAEFLKSDFPRIPFTGKYKLFAKIAAYGEQLAKLH